MAGGPCEEKGGGQVTVNERIRGALLPLGLPVVPAPDTRQRERCFTFNYNLVPFGFADNGPIRYKALIQVHLILPLGANSVPYRYKTIQALVGAGFTWPEVVDATDGETQHFVFETELLTKLEE